MRENAIGWQVTHSFVDWAVDATVRVVANLPLLPSIAPKLSMTLQAIRGSETAARKIQLASEDVEATERAPDDVDTIDRASCNEEAADGSSL